MKKLLSAVTSAVMVGSTMTSAFASLPVSAAGSLSVSQPNFSMGEVLDVSANKTASDGSVEWLIPTVTAAPGQTVTLPVVAKNSSLAVAGAQFNVDAASPIKYKSVTGGDAYTSAIGDNGKGTKFLFDDSNGIEKVAAEGATVFTLAYTIPADCAEGTYDIKWANPNVVDTDGFDLTSKVKFTDGAIKVVKDNGEGKIDWVLDNVTGHPGETVTVKAYVSNKDNAAIAVAGAQYKIDADSPIKYKSFKTGGAYVNDIATNNAKTSFLFNQSAGLGVVAPDNATIMTLTYTIPEDCKEGEYPVKWSKQFVSDTDGFDLTSRINFVDGSIKVEPAKEGQIIWALDDVTGTPGKSVEVKAVVSDTKNTALAVAGAQFKVKTDSTIKYNDFAAGTAYPSDMAANKQNNGFMFRTSTGKAVAAANGATILTITYDIPANCPAGVYPVSWADAFVSDADGYNLTENVIFKDGSITIGDVDPTNGSVSWVIPKVEGKKGESVTLNVKVEGKGDLPVAGAQFEIASDKATPYKSASGTPYGEELRANDKQKFEFYTASGNGKTAKDGDDLFTLTFDVPADCADGVYPVKWAEQFVSDTDGFGITDKVKFVDGAIYVNTPIPVETTTTTQTTTVTTTTTTVVPVPQGGIAWQIGTTQAERGKEVTLDITVVDPDNSKLAIGGAQFVIDNDKTVGYKSISEDVNGYNAKVAGNDAIQKFLFRSEDGKGVAATNGAKVATLTFTVPADCPNGKYYVNFAEGTLQVFDEDGYDLSKLVEGRNGWIEVVDKVVTTTTLAPNQSTTTTTSTSNTGSDPVSTTSVEGSTPSGSTTSVEGSTPSGSTTSVEGSTPGISTTSVEGSTPSGSTTTTVVNTTHQGENVSGTGDVTSQGGIEISNTTSTTSTVSTTSYGYKNSYATIKTEVGYYFSHDDGVRANGEKGGFNKDQVTRLEIVDVYEDGYEVTRAVVDYDLINFNGATPASEYKARTHVPKQTTIDDFKYEIPVYYGDMQLLDKDGKPLTVTAYIGVKGDATLDNMVDSVDASAVLRYYATVSTNNTDVYDVKLQNTVAGLKVESPTDQLDELAAFLADVNTNEWSADNWKTKKDGRRIDSNDASKILAFYARSSSDNYKNVSSYDIWNEVLGQARFGA